MPRHKKPQILIDYENKELPEICHTCEYYEDDGLCFKHKKEPPEYFASTPGACDKYLMEIPF